MTALELKKAFESAFDQVGIIKTSRYDAEAKRLGLTVPKITYPTIVVLGLSYPARIIKHTKTHLVPSFYTFGSDYHQVLKTRIDRVMKDIPYPYILGVDNHPHNERLAAVASGLGFFAKNQLIINQHLGSYFFIGLVLIDVSLEEEVVLEIHDDCGTCRKCITACPTSALYDGGYDMTKCISHYNQSKTVMTDEQIDANYALFGCDICQMVCPKNIKKGLKVHPEFELSGKEMVSIMDLFTLSERQFKQTYEDMSYLWKGKTMLMRNALMVLERHKNDAYIDLIRPTIESSEAPWYKEVATHILSKMEKRKSSI